MSTKRLPPEFGESEKKDANAEGQRELTRRDFVKIASAVGAVGAAVAGSELFTSSAFAAPKKTKIDTPRISCFECTENTPAEIVCTSEVSIALEVCAPSGTGATGLPAGFSVQWMTLADYQANGNAWYASDDVRLCKASFSGNANASRYNLLPGECTIVNIGELLFDNGASTNCPNALEPCTDYVFRAFGHATSTLNRSDFTANLICSTNCNEGDCPTAPNCTFTQGYWKTHGPEGCVTGNNGNEWGSVTSLFLGTVEYTDLQLCSILNTPAAGNGLLSLAHQLIAAKLNIAKGADGTAVAAAISAADVLIGSLVIPPVGSGSLAPSATSALTATLTSFNEGTIGPGHCC